MTPTALLYNICVLLKDGDSKVQLVADHTHGDPFADYTEIEAQEANRRAARVHAWMS